MSLASRIAIAQLRDTPAATVGCAAYAAVDCHGELAEYRVTFADGSTRRVVCCDACREWFALSFRVDRVFVAPWRRNLRGRDETGALVA